MGNERVRFAVTVIGKDRPGIVAGAAEIFYRSGCNIEDSSCTILGGEFAMILIVSHAQPFAEAQLTEDFSGLCARMNLSAFIRTLAPGEEEPVHADGEQCVVTVYGADRPGIVFRVAAELAEHNVNVTDLNTKLVGTKEEPVYVMIIEAVLPAGSQPEALAGVLDTLKSELNVEISVRSLTTVSL